MDSLLDEYVPGWEGHLAAKLNEFEDRRSEAADATKRRRESKFGRYYSEYGQWTQTRSDDGKTIRRRHAFFQEEMLRLLEPTKLDKNRSFTDSQRKTVFFRDMELCQYCRMKGNDHKVSWNESDIHHVLPHTKGGETNIQNAVLVHRECHPRSDQEVKEFQRWWQANQGLSMDSKNPPRSFPPPDWTVAKFEFRGQIHFGEFREGMLVLSGNHGKRFESFSAASKEVTKTSRNGWRDWFLRLPDELDWKLADDWRYQN